MNEVEICIKTNFKTTIKIGKLFRRIFFLIIATVFSANFYDKSFDSFLHNLKNETPAPKIAQKPL